MYFLFCVQLMFTFCRLFPSPISTLSTSVAMLIRFDFSGSSRWKQESPQGFSASLQAPIGDRPPVRPCFFFFLQVTLIDIYQDVVCECRHAARCLTGVPCHVTWVAGSWWVRTLELSSWRGCAPAHWVTHLPSQSVTVLMQSRPTGHTTHSDVIYAGLCKWLTFHRASTSGVGN